MTKDIVVIEYLAGLVSLHKNSPAKKNYSYGRQCSYINSNGNKLECDSPETQTVIDFLEQEIIIR